MPEGANLGLGCGNPQAIAALRPGEVVIDLGSGAGFDCLLAARQVGAEGRVIGVDMTHEMLSKARDNAATHRRRATSSSGSARSSICRSPTTPPTSILSNCVINLVPDKAQVFREAFRVLKPGGRLAISDVVNIAPLPAELAADQALLCGCVAGAASTVAIEDWLSAAGFVDISIQVKPESREFVASWAAGRGIENHVASATIEAHKPAAACCTTDCCA